MDRLQLKRLILSLIGILIVYWVIIGFMVSMGVMGYLVWFMMDKGWSFQEPAFINLVITLALWDTIQFLMLFMGAHLFWFNLRNIKWRATTE